jgi:hypothetical protein
VLLHLLVVLVGVQACGANPAVEDRAASSAKEGAGGAPQPDRDERIQTPVFAGGTTVTDDGIVFTRVGGRPGGEGMTAAVRSKLLVDEKGCLRFDNHPGGRRGWFPLWPPGYSLSTEGDVTRVLDHRGRTKALVGHRVFLGGGLIEVGSGLEERRRELHVPDKCPGFLWMVSPND